MTNRASGERGPELPYPSGWFGLALSRELAPGAVLTRRFAGEDVVLYRTRDGQPHAVRPYCPHLGAHFGAGGTVEGRNLVCPFHRFAFAPDGACVATPDGPPPRARLEHHTVREQNGFLFVWRGHDGSLPDWDVPDTSPPGAVPTASWATDVHAHVQELTENTTDLRHVPVVHHVTVWKADPPKAEGPYLRTHLRLGPNGPALLRKIQWDHTFLLAGMGWLRIELPLPLLGSVIYLWVMHVPIGPRRTRLLIASACTDDRQTRPIGTALVKRPVHRAIARSMLWTAVRKVQDDVRIWNAKRYEPRPRLAAGDEGIGLYRHWARQFYPPG
ncbi:Rieske 2Fe-2S domain-containing protein [Streptomyces sp. NPDC001404]|uniref:Rieske 2Fe-2S domain-containing protein n=1 Tax=Streptomyces sp. NPDC001404 TaxID=3364571 RepID=UPI0036A45DC5